MDPAAFGHAAGAPTQHPLWQGSVSSKWMDAGSGAIRGKRAGDSLTRDGMDGIAARGFGGYFTDVPGRVRESRLQVKAFVREGPLAHMAPPVHSSEFEWRTSRRVCDRTPVVEPTKLSALPPFVPRRGKEVMHWGASCVPGAPDHEVERCARSYSDSQLRAAKFKARQEARAAKGMVQGLENWEREHLARRGPRGSRAPSSASVDAASQGLRSRQSSMSMDAASSARDATQAHPIWRSASQPQFEFCRQRQ